VHARDRDFLLPSQLHLPSTSQQKSIQFDTAFDFDSTLDCQREGFSPAIRVTRLQGIATRRSYRKAKIVSGSSPYETPYTTSDV
jgi:hypothetical protein